MNRKPIVDALRASLVPLSIEITIQNKQAAANGQSAFLPGACIIPTVDFTKHGYPLNEPCIAYGKSQRLINGPKIGDPIGAEDTKFGDDKDIEKAVAQLSGKRVCTVLLAIAGWTHSTYPHRTATASPPISGDENETDS